MPTFFFLSSFLQAANVDVSTATGQTIEYSDDLGIAHIKGEAVVVSSTATLKADEIRINTRNKTGEAEGNVEVFQGTATITGDKATYHWESSTGSFYRARGTNPPWQFSGEKILQKSKKIFWLRDSMITSCDHDPPHYRIRSRKSKITKGERATLQNARFVLEDAPAFWSPFYTRSLLPKKYTLRVEPGQSSRDGITNRTILGYPFTQNSYTKFKWDYLQKTGNSGGVEHRYFSPKANGHFDSLFVRDHNPDPRPQERRFTVLWNHYQRLMDRLTMNAKVDLKSDQTFGNDFSSSGNRVFVENAESGLRSEGGFNYQFKKATLQVQGNRTDKFETSTSSENFISKLTVPRIQYNTIPLKWKYFPFYTSFTGSWVNETLTRSDPNETLRYQRSASGAVNIKKDFRIKKKWTVTPGAGYSQSWNDRDLSMPNSSKDIYNGRYDMGVDVRRRFARLVDVTVGYDITTRLAQNRTQQDASANDQGIERNLFTTSIVSRIGRSSRLSMNTGYDIREPPKDDPTKYSHTSERFISPSVDLQVQLRKQINIFFRETYSLFDSSVDKPVRTPANLSGEIQFGDSTKHTYFSQGFSYTKTPSGQDAALRFTNRLKFYPTKFWHIDFFLTYQAVGPGGLNYKKIEPIEKTISVVRDLHCWVLRFNLSDRTNNREASFHIDLKTNFQQEQNNFVNDTNPTYLYRDDPRDNAIPFLNNENEVGDSTVENEVEKTEEISPAILE